MFGEKVSQLFASEVMPAADFRQHLVLFLKALNQARVLPSRATVPGLQPLLFAYCLLRRNRGKRSGSSGWVSYWPTPSKSWASSTKTR